jgi:hypothetical protein
MLPKKRPINVYLSLEMTNTIEGLVARQFSRRATTLGLILTKYDFYFAGSEREYKRVIELNPNYATAHK